MPQTLEKKTSLFYKYKKNYVVGTFSFNVHSLNPSHFHGTGFCYLNVFQTFNISLSITKQKVYKLLAPLQSPKIRDHKPSLPFQSSKKGFQNPAGVLETGLCLLRWREHLFISSCKTTHPASQACVNSYWGVAVGRKGRTREGVEKEGK